HVEHVQDRHQDVEVEPLHHFWISTRPLLPSIRTVDPSGIVFVAPGSTTAGMPKSRATIALCESMPPRSTTSPAACTKSGVQLGSVVGQTSTYPELRSPASDGERRIRAVPVPMPDATPVPLKTPSWDAGR